MSKELELIESVKKVKQLLKPRKPIVLRNPVIKSIKLNSKMIDYIDAGYTMTLDGYHPEHLMGIDVIRDDTIDYPRYIVEGEIEKVTDDTNHSEALKCLKEIEQKLECCINGGWVLSKDDEIGINIIKQALINAQEQEELLDYLIKFIKNVEVSDNGIYYVSFKNNTPYLNCIEIDKEAYNKFKEYMQK